MTAPCPFATAPQHQANSWSFDGLLLQEDDELEAEMGVMTEDRTPKHPLEHALQLLEKHDAAAAAEFLEEQTGSSSGATEQQQQQPEQQHTEQQTEQQDAEQQMEQQEQQVSTTAAQGC